MRRSEAILHASRLLDVDVHVDPPARLLLDLGNGDPQHAGLELSFHSLLVVPRREEKPSVDHVALDRRRILDRARILAGAGTATGSSVFPSGVGLPPDDEHILVDLHGEVFLGLSGHLEPQVHFGGVLLQLPPLLSRRHRVHQNNGRDVKWMQICRWVVLSLWGGCTTHRKSPGPPLGREGSHSCWSPGLNLAGGGTCQPHCRPAAQESARSDHRHRNYLIAVQL
uniref:Uncharacterized protein n=1 Tax=Arundo donax TaxID=35708 RepID=A0A0A9DK94_ARUDO